MSNQIKIISTLLICVILASSCVSKEENELKKTCRELISQLSEPTNIRLSVDGPIDIENGYSASSVIAEEIINNWSTPERINTIISLVSDNDPFIRQVAIISLGLLGLEPEAMNELISQLGNPDELASEAAYMAFLFMPNNPNSKSVDEINQILMDEWSEDDLLLDMNIAYIVSRGVEDPTILDPLKPAIVKAFESEDPNVRYCAARTVWRNHLLLSEFMPNIIEFLREENSKLKLVALLALNNAYGYGDYTENNVELVLPLIQDRDIDVRMEAATYIGLVSTEFNIDSENLGQALNVLIEILKNDNPYYKFQAARHIGAFRENGRDAVPALIDTFRDQSQDINVRVSIVYAFGSIGPGAESAVPLLIEAIHDDDLQVAALDSLGMIGPGAKDAVPDLIELLHDPDFFTVSDAMEALGGIGPDAEAALPELQNFLQDFSKLTVIDAAVAIKRIHPDSEEAISVLEGLLNDPDSYIAESAREALWRLSE
jgi:HEAT repeat protein